MVPMVLEEAVVPALQDRDATVDHVSVIVDALVSSVDLIDVEPLAEIA